VEAEATVVIKAAVVTAIKVVIIKGLVIHKLDTAPVRS
jgi:hypothetical protein